MDKITKAIHDIATYYTKNVNKVLKEINYLKKIYKIKLKNVNTSILHQSYIDLIITLPNTSYSINNKVFKLRSPKLILRIRNLDNLLQVRWVSVGHKPLKSLDKLSEFGASLQMFHPNISNDGEICWGNIEKLINRHMNRCNIEALIYLTTEFLSTANPDNNYID